MEEYLGEVRCILSVEVYFYISVFLAKVACLRFSCLLVICRIVQQDIFKLGSFEISGVDSFVDTSRAENPLHLQQGQSSLILLHNRITLLS